MVVRKKQTGKLSGMSGVNKGGSMSETIRVVIFVDAENVRNSPALK